MFDDGVEERRYRGGQFEAWKLFQQIDERLLENVQGILMPAREAPGQVVDPVSVARVKLLEGFRIACIDRINQLSIGLHLALRTPEKAGLCDEGLCIVSVPLWGFALDVQETCNRRMHHRPTVVGGIE